jgi:hypothetical protein
MTTEVPSRPASPLSPFRESTQSCSVPTHPCLEAIWNADKPLLPGSPSSPFAPLSEASHCVSSPTKPLS